MPYLFTPPMVLDTPYVNEESPPLARRLFRHYGAMNRGRSVIRVGGVYQTVDSPDQLTLATATEVYLGGHEYIVSDAVGLALIAAGYAATATVAEIDQWSELTARTWESLNLWGSV